MSSVKLISISKGIVDDLITYCARVSNPSNQMNTLTSDKLLKYLVTHNHWSPFEMVSMTLEIKTTRDIARQILRHRSFSFQEFSQRYAEVIDDPIIRDCRMQDSTNRQNSIKADDEELEEWWEHWQYEVSRLSDMIYKHAIKKGIAKEVARSVLPEGLTPSTLYMAGTIRSWIHYVQLRSAEGTQNEHREIALSCRTVLFEQYPALEKVLS